MLSKKSEYFSDYMPNNICFGCGNNTKDGLHIKSYCKLKWQNVFRRQKLFIRDGGVL